MGEYDQAPLPEGWVGQIVWDNKIQILILILSIGDLNGRLWAAAHYVWWVAIMPAFDSLESEIEWFWIGLKMILVIKMQLQHGAFVEAVKVLENLYVQISISGQTF